LTAPAVRPEMIRCWKMSTMMTSGMLTTMPAAMISPKGCWRAISPVKRAMATGTVRAWGSIEVKVRAKSYSFQAAINASRPVVTRAGMVSGSRIM
jgi:hypothetical protein